MALITSHILNGIDGSHAGGVKVSMFLVGCATPITTSQTDEGGRLSIEVDPKLLAPNTMYELVFATQAYWFERGVEGENVISELVLRFSPKSTSAKYHMPIILSPYSYSTWKSG